MCIGHNKLLICIRLWPIRSHKGSCLLIKDLHYKTFNVCGVKITGTLTSCDKLTDWIVYSSGVV